MYNSYQRRIIDNNIVILMTIATNLGKPDNDTSLNIEKCYIQLGLWQFVH